jgi:hypothetical protein
MTAIAYDHSLTPPTSPSTRSVGFWSAVLATLFSITYDVGQVAEWLGWLGSSGGPESTSTPLGIVVLLTPSHGAVAFATAYAVLISSVYFVQLTLVGPRMASGRVEGIEPFVFVPFDSYLYAVDILGYSFMSVSTLLAGRAFTGRGVERVARWFLTANGLLVPFLVFQMYVHALIWIAALWAVTFPGATWALAVYFRRLRTAPAG